MNLDFSSPEAERGGQLARMLLAARRAVEEDQEEAADDPEHDPSGTRLYLQVLNEVMQEAKADADLLPYLLSALASHAHLLLRWSASYLPYALEATEGSEDADDIPTRPAGEVEMLEYLATLNEGKGLVF